MGLFVCDKCHCIENTVFGRYWSKDYKDLWSKDNLGKALCSECAPITFKSGEPAHKEFGKWHDEFPKEIVTKESLKE